MRRMWSDLLSWIVGGLMSSSTHAASFCLPICAASLQFQCTYVCFNSLCLLFDLPHLLLRHLESIFKAPCLLHASGLWKKRKKKIAVQTTDVCSDPRPPHPFLKEWYVPNLWHKLTKYVEKRGEKWFLCSNCEASAHLRVSVGWWLLRLETASPIFFFFSTLAMIQSCPCFALPTKTMWQLSVHAYVCMFVHTRSKCPIQV